MAVLLLSLFIYVHYQLNAGLTAPIFCKTSLLLANVSHLAFLTHIFSSYMTNLHVLFVSNFVFKAF